MEYTLLGIASVIIIALISWYLAVNYKKADGQRGRQKSASGQKNMQPVKCPICGSELFVGENIISKVYRPMNVPDQLMTIIGCPHCYPKCEAGLKRTCPVCHQPMKQEDALTARLFNKQLGKKHVHIVGCSNCHKPRAD